MKWSWKIVVLLLNGETVWEWHCFWVYRGHLDSSSEWKCCCMVFPLAAVVMGIQEEDRKHVWHSYFYIYKLPGSIKVVDRLETLEYTHSTQPIVLDRSGTNIHVYPTSYIVIDVSFMTAVITVHIKTKYGREPFPCFISHTVPPHHPIEQPCDKMDARLHGSNAPVPESRNLGHI